MLGHCVNPDCRVSLQSFNEGRLFQFEIVSISVPASDECALPFDEKPRRQTSHFWLCGTCASTMLVTLEPLEGLKLVPLHAAGIDAIEAPSHARPDTRQLSHC
jgi:hypothetical protein